MPSTTEIALFAVLAATVAACDDMTPNFVEPPEAQAPAADAGTDAAGPGAPPACVACLMAPDMPGPGCQTEITACQANTSCAADLECLYSSGCFGQTATGFISCGIPCGDKNGVTLGASGYSLAVAMFTCVVQGACESVCISQ